MGTISLSGLVLSNLGCEAILRGTVKILRAALGKETVFRLPCFNVEQDKRRLSDLPGIQFIQIPRIRVLAQNALRRLDLPSAFYDTCYPLRYRLSDLVDGACTAVLSVGGDSYATPTGRLHWDLVKLQRACRRRGVPFFIWGANFEPFRPKVREIAFRHLKESAMVFARDQESVDYLAAHGIAENVQRVCDPGFLMDAQEWDVEPFLPKHRTDLRVGITLSPLAERLFPERRVADTLAGAVERFIDVTGQSVVLISHVFSLNPADDDGVFCRRVYAKIGPKYQPLVGLADKDVGSPKMKYLISQMHAYAGARMHGTIAAYSSLVPTIALAYSGKGKALNALLFDDERWLLPVSQLTPESLSQKLVEILESREVVRKRLAERIPAMKEQACIAGGALKKELSGLRTADLPPTLAARR